jgi:hypothetical protein
MQQVHHISQVEFDTREQNLMDVLDKVIQRKVINELYIICCVV